MPKQISIFAVVDFVKHLVVGEEERSYVISSVHGALREEGIVLWICV